MADRLSGEGDIVATEQVLAELDRILGLAQERLEGTLDFKKPVDKAWFTPTSKADYQRHLGGDAEYRRVPSGDWALVIQVFDLESRDPDPEEVTLVHKTPSPVMAYRGKTTTVANSGAASGAVRDFFERYELRDPKPLKITPVG